MTQNKEGHVTEAERSRQKQTEAESKREDAVMLALKMKEGAMSHGMQGMQF